MALYVTVAMRMQCWSLLIMSQGFTKTVKSEEDWHLFALFRFLIYALARFSG